MSILKNLYNTILIVVGFLVCLLIGNRSELGCYHEISNYKLVISLVDYFALSLDQLLFFHKDLVVNLLNWLILGFGYDQKWIL